MNRLEATQYQAEGIGILRGADMDYEGPETAPCFACGREVNLESAVSFTVQEIDGSETTKRMTEAAARSLMLIMGIESPPVFCEECGRIHEA